MGWWLLRLPAKILALLRLKVKIFQFLRLLTKFLAVLRLSVNPIETLLNCKRGWNIKDLFPGLRYSAPIEQGAYSQTTMHDTVTKRNASTGP